MAVVVAKSKLGVLMLTHPAVVSLTVRANSDVRTLVRGSVRGEDKSAVAKEAGEVVWHPEVVGRAVAVTVVMTLIGRSEVVSVQILAVTVVGVKVTRVSETGAAEAVIGVEGVVVVTEVEEAGERARAVVGVEGEVPWVAGVVVMVETRLLEYVEHLGRQS